LTRIPILPPNSLTQYIPRGFPAYTEFPIYESVANRLKGAGSGFIGFVRSLVSEWLFDAVEPWNHSWLRPVGQNPFGANFRVRRYSLLAAQHGLEMFRRALPTSAARSCLDRLSNRLTKIAAEARKLRTR